MLPIATLIILCFVYLLIYKTGLRSLLDSTISQRSWRKIPPYDSREQSLQKSRRGIPSFHNTGKYFGGHSKIISNVSIGQSANTDYFDESLLTRVVYENASEIRVAIEKNELARVSDNEACETRNFIVHLCLRSTSCRGWADRQKGIISTYLLALLTNRYFVIVHNNPCELSEFLAPNTYNWTSCTGYILSVPKSMTETLVLFGKTERFGNVISHTDVNAMFKKQVIFIRTNQIWNDAILAHPKAAENIPWALGKRPEEIKKLVLARLFRPREALEREIGKYMANVHETQKLICSHIRIGQNPSIPHDFKRSGGPPNVTSVFQFLKRYDSPSKYVIYVATDSQAVRESARELFTGSFTVNLPIVHVDNYRGQKDTCMGAYAALLEQYLLSKCDLLVLTRGGFGKMAAYMSEKVQDLFVFDQKSKTIVNITRKTL